MNIPPHSNHNDEQPEDEGDEVDKAFAAFNAKFPDKDDIETFVRELFRSTKGKCRIRCKHCGSDDVTFLDGGRVIECDQCNKHTFVTASTFFKNVKHVRAWVAAIWFLERGVAVSKSRFSRLLEIAFSTAWGIFKKFSIVIQSKMDSQALFVPSEYFRKAISKRSRSTAGRRRPFEEEKSSGRLFENLVTETGGLHNQTKNINEVSSSSANPLMDLSPLQIEIFNLLCDEPIKLGELQERTGKLAHEILSAISMLEILGLAVKADNGYLKVQTSSSNPDASAVSPQDLKTINSFISFVHGTFHGISRKYLQLFLAEYWCLLDKNRWKIDSLLMECQRFGFVHDKEIPAYESPQLVKMKL